MQNKYLASFVIIFFPTLSLFFSPSRALEKQNDLSLEADSIFQENMCCFSVCLVELATSEVNKLK